MPTRSATGLGPARQYRQAVDRLARATGGDGTSRRCCDELAPDGCGGLLVWGDPALYDSTIRIVDSIRRAAGWTSTTR